MAKMINQKQKKYIFGVHPVLEALRSDAEIEKVIMKIDFRSPHKPEIFALTKLKKIPLQYVSNNALNKLSNYNNHQGILAQLSVVTYHDIEQLVPFWYEMGIEPIVLILDKITDVRNVGSIIRTAECAGVSAIVVPWKNTAEMSEITAKTSSGALFTMKICRTSSLVNTAKFLIDNGFNLIACTEKAPKIYYEHQYTLPLAIILGSEEKGIASELIRLSHVQLKIPLLGNISSLNVSVACGIFLYEIIRQTKYKI